MKSKKKQLKKVDNRLNNNLFRRGVNYIIGLFIQIKFPFIRFWKFFKKKSVEIEMKVSFKTKMSLNLN